MSRRQFRLAAAAVSALAVATLCTGAPAAFADPGDPYRVNGTSQENPGNTALINPSADVQLEIHKYLGAPTGAGDGTEQTITDRDALQGVRFDVYRVGGVDLTTNQGWAAATALSGYQITAADIAGGSITVGGTSYALTLVSSPVTDGEGTATFTQADGVGLYLVNENLAGSGTITNVTSNSEVAKASITSAAPFFVTLPMTNPDDTSRWIYDVDVYPKNQTDSATKSVEDKGTVTSDNGNVGEHGIDYTITTSITDGSDPLGLYVIYDDLHPSLTFAGASLALSNGTTFTAGTHYNVYTAADWETAGTLYSSGEVAGGPLVTIVFTDAGLEILEANRSESVVTTLNTILGVQDEDGVIENEAVFIPNESWWDQNGKPGVDPEDPTTPPGDPSDPTDPWEPGIPTNPVESKYGNLVVNKQDPTDTGADMSGAEFAIYADPTPGDGNCSAGDVTGTPIDTGTIGAGNTLTFAGLQASNWYDGADVADEADWLSYCLVETKAPTGYNLDATPHYITVDWETGSTTAPALATELVNNEKSNLGNNLPLTGGDGVAALSVAGLVLVGGGVVYYAATSRRRRKAESTVEQ
ncbi:SpaH/EbpB family LPXTG-anchored major pilin [Propionicicella superfundia]|uniref:SpaH/EbpB family LPXTG-anchored major pilin n=1 Tax=Propionicicella superfundia TaxID=348582 RepID=UPI000409C9B8|nr:SpaH/EbpB family LPXTG-anchored major pilin [Propionicicella superfundia]